MEQAAPDPRSLLTTAQLAQRTGVPAGTLRMWEARHGFPVPARLPGGHRRYSERDVERVGAVIGLRQEGLSLRAAITRASDGRSLGPPSIFAGLRERRPDLQPMTIGKPGLLALTRAIEDEYCARARSGVMIGSFQAERFYRHSEWRWRELARTAQLAIALAEFDAPRELGHSLYEVPIGRRHPLAREWAIVFSAPDASACLAAWEIPEVRARGDAERRFEVLWSPEPDVVRVAVELASELIAPLAPPLAARLQATLSERPPATTPELRVATAQAHRMLSYLAARAP